jgi:hypothetical protein
MAFSPASGRLGSDPEPHPSRDCCSEFDSSTALSHNSLGIVLGAGSRVKRRSLNEGMYGQDRIRGRVPLQYQTRSTLTVDPADPGKALYEERLKLLEGLWMPAAPPWDELSDEVKQRWRSHAAENNAGDSA